MKTLFSSHGNRTCVWNIFIAILLMLSILGASKPQIGKAQSDSPSKELIELSKKYGLIDVDFVPEGIKPISFTKIDELEKFLSAIHSETSISSHVVLREKPQFNILAIQPNSTSYSVVTRSCSTNVGYGIAKFNTWADIKVGYSGSFRWIVSVLSTRVGLTGWTMTGGLSNEYSYAYNQTSSSVSVKGGAMLDVYLFVEGLIKLYSVPVSCSFTYSLY